MKTNQKGFTPFTLVLIGFTLIVAAWFVYSNYLSQPAPKPAATQPAVQPPAKTVPQSNSNLTPSPRTSAATQTETPNKQLARTNESNDDSLLNKMFPNFVFNNGVAQFPPGTGNSGLGEELFLQKKEEGSFANIGAKERLFWVMDSPTPHVEGMFHAYLGLFDFAGNLLTKPFVLPKPNTKYCDSCPEVYNAEKDNAFVADDGTFDFYDCKGIKFLLFVYLWRPNGGICGSGGADVMKFENDEFEIVQEITTDILTNNPIVGAAETKYKYGIIIYPQDGKIAINRVQRQPQDEGNFFEDCKGLLYKTLDWNTETCQFE